MTVLTKAPLWRFTTLKVGGEADSLYQPESSEELVEIISKLNHRGEPWSIIGGGSNLLVSSKGVAGAVIRTTQMTRITTQPDGLLEADAGARLPHLAKYAASLSMSGLEYAVGIPGTVGGAVIMNAGAHGSATEEILESARVFDCQAGQVLTLTKDELGFQYRKCNLDPKRHVVLSARFKLDIQERSAIEEKTRHNEEYRWQTQPLGWPNAGSTFKNPEPKRSAGMLLDQAGAKTLKEGAAAVSAVHANFVINLGGATSNQVVSLLKKMQECVQTKFDVTMHPEWKVLGTFTESELEVWKV